MSGGSLNINNPPGTPIHIHFDLRHSSIANANVYINFVSALAPPSDDDRDDDDFDDADSHGDSGGPGSGPEDLDHLPPPGPPAGPPPPFAKAGPPQAPLLATLMVAPLPVVANGGGHGDDSDSSDTVSSLGLCTFRPDCACNDDHLFEPEPDFDKPETTEPETAEPVPRIQRPRWHVPNGPLLVRRDHIDDTAEPEPPPPPTPKAPPPTLGAESPDDTPVPEPLAAPTAVPVKARPSTPHAPHDASGSDANSKRKRPKD